MPAAEKKGNEKGFDQRERVAFSGHSFLKRVTAGDGGKRVPSGHNGEAVSDP